MLSASSLDRDTAEALTALLTERADLRAAIAEAKPLARIDLKFSDRDWISRLGPVDPEASGLHWRILSLTPRDRAYGGFQRILNLVLATGIGSLLAALPLSYLMDRALLRPVRTLADAAELAVPGNDQTKLGNAGSDELARLARAFDDLLSELREKSEIDSYVSNLSRFLPEPIERRAQSGDSTHAVRETIRPPDLINRIVLGIDCRALAKPVGRDQADRLGDGIKRFTATISDACHRAQAHVLGFNGIRAVLGFSGEDSLARALRTARFLRRDAGLPNELSATLAMAIHEGDVIEGRMALGDGTIPVAGGGTLHQLGRLLSESSEQQLLVANWMLERVKPVCGSDAKAAIGLVSGRAFPILELSQLDALDPLSAADGAIASEHPTAATRSTYIAATKRSPAAGHRDW